MFKADGEGGVGFWFALRTKTLKLRDSGRTQRGRFHWLQFVPEFQQDGTIEYLKWCTHQELNLKPADP